MSTRGGEQAARPAEFDGRGATIGSEGDDVAAGSGLMVSVVVPAWNVEPWIDQCLASVAVQTIGTDAMELVVVDDGSTDGTGAALDAFAASNPWMRVAHQANSGGPGAPRNAGVALARGRYVFFLDADDYLAPEAIERLVAMAERNGSDIVVARIVGVEGRYKGGALRYRRDVDRADLMMVSRSGNVLKLFRRALIVDNRLEFRPGIPGGEDGDFMQRAYLAAGTISVLGSYDAYFARRRPGSQTTRRDRSDDLADVIARVESERIAPIAERVGPGARRDAILASHLARVASKFGRRWSTLEPEERARVFGVGTAIVTRWCTPLIMRAQHPRNAIRLYCLAHGMLAELERIAAAPVDEVFGSPVIEGRRIFAAYPHFRDGSGIPDRYFEMTRRVHLNQWLYVAEVDGSHLELAGIAYLALVGGTPFARLRRWPSGREYDIPIEITPTRDVRDKARSYPMAGFRASLDLASAAHGRPLGRGSWEICVGARIDGIERLAAASLRAPQGSRPGRKGTGAPAGAPRLVVLPHGRIRVHVPNLPLPAAVLEPLAARAAVVVGRLRDGGARLLERTRTGQVAMMMTRSSLRSVVDEDDEAG